MEKVFTKLFILIALLLWIVATLLLGISIVGILVFMVVEDWGEIGDKLVHKLTS